MPHQRDPEAAELAIVALQADVQRLKRTVNGHPVPTGQSAPLTR